MKKFFFGILVLLTTHASSQNFLPFHKDRPAYYNFSSDHVFYTQAGISIDSFEVFGSDTVLYEYPIIDYDNSNGCYIKAHDTSFVGHHSIRTANGDDEFFNRYGDTVFFRNNSTVNDNWTILNLNSGNKIVATVQSITLESVLGVNDSVKKISLQAKDSSGNNISDIFNNKIFKIGKSFGLISGYSLFHFPFDTVAFSIVGIENPSHGLSSENLTPEKIFDFEVGDRFDYDGGWNTEPTYHYHYCLIKVILNKEISAGGDSLIYVEYIRTHWNGNNWNYYYEGSQEYTTTEIFDLNAFEDVLRKPYQFSPFIGDYEGGPSWLLPSQFAANETIVDFNDLLFNWNDTCLEWIVWGTGPGDIQYANGLGKVYTYYGWNSQNIYESLLYYNKNGIEWGDSINCPIATGEFTPTTSLVISIFPNPTNSQLFISGNFSPSQTHFTLLNSLGEEMNLTQLSNQFGSISFDVHELPPGLYVLQVKKEDEVVNLKFVKE